MQTYNIIAVDKIRADTINMIAPIRQRLFFRRFPMPATIAAANCKMVLSANATADFLIPPILRKKKLFIVQIFIQIKMIKKKLC